MEAAERAFFDAVEPHRKELRLHCYRMLGSSHDGDDAVQETLIHAWRARSTLEDASRLRPWLYRIATNACLDELKKRPRRATPQDMSPPTDPAWPLDAPPLEEASWIEPMPDTWLAGEAERDPSALYSLKESVALAFVAALHVLSPAQRATLLLRDDVDAAVGGVDLRTRGERRVLSCDARERSDGRPRAPNTRECPPGARVLPPRLARVFELPETCTPAP